MVLLLQRNSQQVNQVIRAYQSKQSLTVYKGKRVALPADAYPSLEIEPGNAANQWATTRAQRPRYDFTCTLTVRNENEKYAVEYICTVATVLVQIMTSPENLQLPVVGETKWSPSGGLSQTYILDSLVESVTYGASKAGTIRTAEISWFADIHEPYPESKWAIGYPNEPSVLKPTVIP